MNMHTTQLIVMYTSQTTHSELRKKIKQSTNKYKTNSQRIKDIYVSPHLIYGSNIGLPPLEL